MNLARISLLTGFVSVLCVTLVPWALLKFKVDPVYANAAGAFVLLAIGAVTAAFSKRTMGFQMSIWSLAFFMAFIGLLGNSWSSIALFVLSCCLCTYLFIDSAARTGLHDRAVFGGMTFLVLADVPKLVGDDWNPFHIAAFALVVWILGLAYTQQVPERAQAKSEESQGGVQAWKRSRSRVAMRREA